MLTQENLGYKEKPTTRYECSGVKKGCLEANESCQFDQGYVAICSIFPGRYSEKGLESSEDQKLCGVVNSLPSKLGVIILKNGEVRWQTK